MWGCHSGTDEDLYLLGCDAASTGKRFAEVFYERIASFFRVKRFLFWGVLDPEHEDTMLHLNVGNCLPT